MDLKKQLWIKKTAQSIIKDVKKDMETELLTVTFADVDGTTITISGDPNVLGWLETGLNTLGWLESELDVSVHVKPKVAQKTSIEGAHPATGKQQPVNEGPADEDKDPAIDE